jgi:hypothetical protein
MKTQNDERLAVVNVHEGDTKRLVLFIPGGDRRRCMTMYHPLLSLYSTAIVGVMGLGPAGCFWYTIETHVHGAVVGMLPPVVPPQNNGEEPPQTPRPATTRISMVWTCKGLCFCPCEGRGSVWFWGIYKVLKDNSLCIFMPWKGGVFKGVGVFSTGECKMATWALVYIQTL